MATTARSQRDRWSNEFGSSVIPRTAQGNPEMQPTLVLAHKHFLVCMQSASVTTSGSQKTGNQHISNMIMILVVFARISLFYYLYF